MKRQLQILVLVDTPTAHPRGYDYAQELAQEEWHVERQIIRTLRANGHIVHLLGIHNDIKILLEEVEENPPDVIFNLVEVFHSQPYFDKNIAWVLDMLQIPYTGASPTNLLICNNKALNKKILTYHHIPVPKFQIFNRNRKFKHPQKLNFPLIVKPLHEEASRGIALASITENESALRQRVEFIHTHIKSAAIAEEYIPGREFYISILGHKHLQVLPPREMKFGHQDKEEPKIATYKAKWDEVYRNRWGIKNVFAGRLSESIEAAIHETCCRAYKALNLQSYARFDIRVTPQGEVYVLETNANPSLDKEDELAESADKIGITYNQLLNKIVTYAFQREDLG